MASFISCSITQLCVLIGTAMNISSTLPEYLHIFGEDGPVSIQVFGPAGLLPLPARKISAEDIAWLVSLDGQLLRTEMSFDGQVMQLQRCELNPTLQSIRLFVQ